MRKIVYLFAGTYGDFVQALRPLQALAATARQARIYLVAPKNLVADFRFLLPASVERVGFLRAWWLGMRPADLLLTNAIGVFRVRFDVLACLCGRMALGFRHSQESQRLAYTATLPLTPILKNFESANLALLRLAGISRRSFEGSVPAFSPASPTSGTDRVLFHVGSAGMRKAMGLNAYVSLIRQAIEVMGPRLDQIIYGPGDEEVVEELCALSIAISKAISIDAYSISDLAHRVLEYPGSIVCFNSFFAHFCRVLEKPAVVLHLEKIPFGYDCDPLHAQIVLPLQGPWDLAPLQVALVAGIKPTESFSPKLG